MKCSICKEKITADPYGWEGGCNAQPINDGTCWYKCDKEVVLPRRLADAGFYINNVTAKLIKENENDNVWYSRMDSELVGVGSCYYTMGYSYFHDCNVNVYG